MLNPHIPSRNEENAQKLKQNEFFASHARYQKFLAFGCSSIARSANDCLIGFRVKCFLLALGLSGCRLGGKALLPEFFCHN
jgi:hypothetical protein